MTLEMKLNETRYEGRVEGIAIGEKRGIQKNAIETAKNFIKMNVLTLEEIALGTKLSLKQVQELKNAD